MGFLFMGLGGGRKNQRGLVRQPAKARRMYRGRNVCDDLRQCGRQTSPIPPTRNNNPMQ